MNKNGPAANALPDAPLADHPERPESDDDLDIPIELLALVPSGERIWPQVFPGL